MCDLSSRNVFLVQSAECFTSTIIMNNNDNGIGHWQEGNIMIATSLYLGLHL